METADLISLLNRLRSEPDETEWLEFKANRYDPQTLGEYLSALANSACIQGKTRGYLVFGIENKTHEIVGTSFNPLKEKGKGNQNLLIWLSKGLLSATGFEHYEFRVDNKNVVLFEVFSATDCPVKFYGQAFVRIGSSKTLLANHPEKERIIWQRKQDWSGKICEQATIVDLDNEAIKKARLEYKSKIPQKSLDVDQWDDETFLNKVGLAIHGNISNSAMVLLGKPESVSLISPAIARISWILKDEKNVEKDYEHFDPPFILNVDRILAKIRNLTIRQLPSGTLFPVEISQYDPWVLREALHNCIAHQDYSLGGRINLIESLEKLILTNRGSFLPGSIETVISQDSPLEIYRNPTLVRIMVNLNMIDSQGGGIKRMFQAQMKRFFPMPDYDLSDSERVVVSISGAILDEKYTRLLMERTDLDLWEVLLLDKVQKDIRITHDESKKLKELELVEGRYPNLLISAKVAKITNQKVKHIRSRGLDRKYYSKMILELIRIHAPIQRGEIDRLLLDKLPENLSIKKKQDLIHNLISSLRQSGQIQNIGSKKYPKWVLR
ncbi:MAG TPA: RNA-binding domain-containing protein [Patescibacteria group bacterium]|nr:RNA-binding domain-containing protein [Patescibacteria group bacterium]